MSFTDPKAKGSIEVGRGDGFDVLPVGADREVVLADSAQAKGLKWGIPSAVSAQFPLWMFGDGSDGDLTLVADTVLSVDVAIQRYDNLDLAGFSIENDPSAFGITFFIKGTLTLGGGTVRGAFQNATNVGGAGGGTTGGAGGDSGRGRGFAWVFAKTIVGTGTIHSDGEVGIAGVNGAVQSATSPRAFGVVGTGVGDTYYIQGNQAVSFAPNPGNTPGGAYTGGPGGSATSGVTSSFSKFNYADIDAIVLHGYPNLGSYPTPLIEGGWGRAWGPGIPGGSGGGGNEAEGSVFPSVGRDGEAGGGGGSGGQSIGGGGAGGNGGDGNGNDPAGSGSGASGPGGGGGGSSGGFVCVLTNSAPATLTVSANGAAGGNGGDGTVGSGPSARESGGGGGGGGGSGGTAALIAQAANGATVTVTGGAGGTGGAAGGGASTAGSSGVAGDSGQVFNLTYN